MKKNISKFGAVLFAAALCVWSNSSPAQVTVTETATINSGTITEFAPSSDTLIMRTETSPAPLQYRVTKETTFVDETGAPVVVEKVTRGLPATVEYRREGDRLVASRIVVRRTAPLIEERTTTTTTEERALTHDEKERLKKERKAEKEQLEHPEKGLRRD